MVASGLGADTGGGVYALHPGGAVETIDRLSTTGLAVSPGGGLAARFPWTDDDPNATGEALLYDGQGAVRYARIDGLREPHTALWTGEQTLAVVSTRSNTILWLDADLRIIRRWAAPGTGDCWHLNSLTVADGRLLASAFGRFAEHRDWAAPGARDGAGVVFDVETGRDVLSGLSAPHDPRYVDGRWHVCNSGTQELWVVEDGDTVARVPLGGWTRGLRVEGDRVLVGVSAPPLERCDGYAHVVALDRATLRPGERWALPCRQVFALEQVSPTLLTGLRVGFATNALRAAEAGPTALLEVGGGARSDVPVPESDCAARLVVTEPPATVLPGRPLTLTYRFVNLGSRAFSSRGELPVRIGGDWTAAGHPCEGAFRAPLPGVVPAGGEVPGSLLVTTPAAPGDYVLRIAPLQEHVRWFDGAGTESRFAIRVLAA